MPSMSIVFVVKLPECTRSLYYRRGATGKKAGDFGGPVSNRGRAALYFGQDHYLLYSKMFKSLPVPTREAVYRRLWSILSREERGPKYVHLDLDRRKAIVEILRDTKDDLPTYFHPIER